MTLDTRVAIGKPHNVREIFDFCNQMLGAPAEVLTEHQDCDGDRAGQRGLLNKPLQGLPAWLWMFYGVDGPMVHRHTKWCETEVGPAKWDDDGTVMVTQAEVDEHAASVAADPTENGWAAIEVSFDTAYGYRGEGGESCSDLHARLVTALGLWLDKRGLPWKWKNEYTGEWHDGADGLDRFGAAHRASGADAWFRNQVMPVIANGTLGGAR